MVFLESSCLLTVWTKEVVRAFTVSYVLGSRRFCPVSLLCDGCAAACNSTSCNQTTHNQSKALSHVFASRVSFNFDKWQSARWQRDSEPLNFSILTHKQRPRHHAGLPSTKKDWFQQLFHQMGRDGVPLDEVSNRMNRISYLKGRRQQIGRAHV